MSDTIAAEDPVAPVAPIALDVALAIVPPKEPRLVTRQDVEFIVTPGHGLIAWVVREQVQPDHQVVDVTRMPKLARRLICADIRTQLGHDVTIRGEAEQVGRFVAFEVVPKRSAPDPPWFVFLGNDDRIVTALAAYRQAWGHMMRGALVWDQLIAARRAILRAAPGVFSREELVFLLVSMAEWIQAYFPGGANGESSIAIQGY